MLDKIDPFWVIMGFLAVSVVVMLLFHKNNDDPLQDKLNKFKTSLLLGGIFLGLMYLIMPMTPGLSTFGYPEDAASVDTPEEVLKYLQRYNEAMVKTIDIIRWTFFIMAFWVVGSGYRFLTAFSHYLKEVRSNNHEDSIS